MAEERQKGLGYYVTLGRSGLRVSPLALGTGTFGNRWGAGWSAEEPAIRAVFQAYSEEGGNFLDTADIYHTGLSEEYTGKLARDFGGRDRFVIATKFTLGTTTGDPNANGNGRKNIVKSAEDSLKRLGTDYIDLYYMHWWDALTPVEEVMSSLDALVRSGKVRYIGLSNPPAWYFAKGQTVAQFRGWEPVIALQMQYNLLVRDIEDEYIDAAREFGTAIVPWSPLANGLLSGKYRVENGKLTGAGRVVDGWVTDPNVDPTSERTGRTIDALVEVAKAIGATPAQVALNWLQTQPGVASTIIGATKPEQVRDNIGALKIAIPAELRARLEEASAPAPGYPYTLTMKNNRAAILGQTDVRRQAPW